jgi:hypothetical protein
MDAARRVFTGRSLLKVGVTLLLAALVIGDMPWEPDTGTPVPPTTGAPNIHAYTDKPDCAAIAASLPGFRFPDGLYGIQVGGFKKAILVLCDFSTDDGGWTHIQARIDGSVSFERSWAEYVTGFGDLLGEFWLGLENIHLITIYQRYVLRIEMTDCEGLTKFEEYDNFVVGGSSCKFRLNSVGAFCGDAGDSLTYHVGMYFSTADQDNDVWTSNCAVTYKGAWWYKDCHLSNLCGAYHDNCYQPTYADGIDWFTAHGYNYSYKAVAMKVRPLFFF